MSSNTNYLEVMRSDEITPDQEAFIHQWNQHFFSEQVGISRRLKQAPVHWHIFWRNDQTLLSHVALTELEIELDDQPMTVGALGGLFTPPDLQDKGFATTLMDQAEVFLFDHLKLPLGLLFCLPEMVPFYTERHWTNVIRPVTLEQETGIVTWMGAVMMMNPDRVQNALSKIHVPLCR